MPKLPVVKARGLIRILKKLGFSLSHVTGSHAQLKNVYNKRVTIPMHNNKEITPKTLKSILKDAELSIEEFVRLLRK
ncbi:MAG: type II toxin-antitoxin system HicA family toxin [Patescibacteria group bacterium]